MKLILECFSKMDRENSISLQSDKHNRYCTWGPIYIFDHISLNFSHGEKCRENQYNHFFFFENRAVYEVDCIRVRDLAVPMHLGLINGPFVPVYEVVWKSNVEPDRPKMTRWRMRIACRIPKTTKCTLEMCCTHCFSTVTMVVRTRLNVTKYVRCLLFLPFVHKQKNSLLRSDPSGLTPNRQFSQ
jgi:hypothetical protein